MARKPLTSQHRKAISDGLKLHHKRNRRSKTFFGRVVNRLTPDTKNSQRNTIKGQQISKISAQIKDLKGKIAVCHKQIMALASHGSVTKNRRQQLVGQISQFQQDIARLKLSRKRLRGQPTV